MLRFVVRRILWAVPTIFGISIVAFLVTTLIPAPRALGIAEQKALLARDPDAYDAYREQRHELGLDLPRFVNPAPRDVRSIVADCVAHISADDEQAALAAHRLALVGGAAFPFLLPTFDRLDPAGRERVALALTPIAERMGEPDVHGLDAKSAPTFWVQLWEDRSLEFTGPAVRRTVERLTHGASAGRERDLIEVDTFALPELLRAIGDSRVDGDGLARISKIATHVSGHPVMIPAELTPSAERRIRREWSAWWATHADDYVALGAGERIFATLAKTRYGFWLRSAATGELGTTVRDGEPAVQKLAECGPVTLVLIVASMLLSFGFAVPAGVIAARRRGQSIDHLLAGGLFLLYALPSYFLAELLVHAAGTQSGSALRAVLATLVMTGASTATLSRFQRAAMLDVLGQDYVRTARAKGLRERRVLVVHALRNAVLPTVTLAGLQLPFLFGTAIVVEEVFELPGMGYETMRAVESHDAGWLVVTVLVVALATTITILTSDIGYAILDPRIRERLLGADEKVA